VSPAALAIATENSIKNQLLVHFQQLNILDTTQWAQCNKLDIIVSNPPYICPHEARDMHRNVKDYEPHLALFVSNEDPLQFYKTIAAFGLEKLNTEGRIYCEIHQDHALEVKNCFITAGYKNVEIKKDLNGHNRMIKACWQ
jgi:release factor glutamine methyltransferase